MSEKKLSKLESDISPYLNLYNELLNSNTARYIVDSLIKYTDLIDALTHKEIIRFIFLFSGPKPDCEFEICKILKVEYGIDNLFVILVDINNPKEDSNYKKNKESYGINKLGFRDFYSLNNDFTHLLERTGKLFLQKYTYCIAIHPQHNSLAKAIINKNNKFAESKKLLIYGMYDFFNKHWLNKKVLYVFRGNPEYYESEKDFKLLKELSLATNNFTSIVFKPPVIVIFCTSVEEQYIDIHTIFNKGESKFNLPKDGDGYIMLNEMTVKNNDDYVFNDCKSKRKSYSQRRYYRKSFEPLYNLSAGYYTNTNTNKKSKSKTKKKPLNLKKKNV